MTHFSRRALLTTAGAVTLTACSPGPAGADERQYANSPFRRITDAQWRERLPRAAYDVLRHEATEAMTGIDPEGLNGTNRMRLHVFGDRGGDQVRLVALLDNLGKGASGAAVQNLNLMLGLDEGTGLS